MNDVPTAILLAEDDSDGARLIQDALVNTGITSFTLNGWNSFPTPWNAC